MIPLAIQYQRRRASGWKQLRKLGKIRRRERAGIHADEACKVLQECDRINDCLKCSHIGECCKRYDRIVSMTDGY